MLKLLSSILVFSSSFMAQARGPSRTDCEYYRTLESQYQCGPDAYFQLAYPLCEKYRREEAHMNSEIQEFFPKVRFCLQEKLAQSPNLNCENLNAIAIQSHVDCYKETGYCDMSWTSQSQLTWMTLPQMTKPLWRETAKAILEVCRQK